MASAPRQRFSLRALNLAFTSLFGLFVLGDALTLAWSSGVIWRSAQGVERDTHVVDVIREIDRTLREHVRIEILWIATREPDLQRYQSELESQLRGSLADLGTSPDEAERIQLRRCSDEIDAYLAAREVVEARGLPLEQAVRTFYPSFDRALAVIAAFREDQEKDRARSRVTAERALRNQKLEVAVSALVLVCALTAVIIGVHRLVLRPILELQRTVQRFRAGDTCEKVSGGALSETRELADRFNEMLDAIARQHRDQLTFLTAVAHDLRNPLAALKLAVQSFKVEPVSGIPERLMSLNRQLDRLDRITGDLLDVTRIESGQIELRLEDFDLSEVARSLVEFYAPAASKHQVILKAPGQPLIVRGDRHRIEQVFDNLLSNAIKYSSEGGPVEVSVAAAGGEAVLSVQDRGVGIPPEDLPDLFLPFHRRPATADLSPGLGLGLSIIRRIVDAHGGRIEVESTPGVGSTFRVRLPLGGRAGTPPSGG